MISTRTCAGALALGVLASLPALAQDGPGLGNRAYGSGDHMKRIARIDGGDGAPRGHGFVAMHRGYLLVIFSRDSGGGNGSGGFALLDVSDPRNPRTAFTTHNNPDYARGTPDYAGDIREAHGFSFSGDILCTPTNKGQGTGVQFWDFSTLLRPRKVGFLRLPGLGGGDYSPTPWWLCWQGGHTVYVAGTSGGLYLVDASDPSRPRLVDRGGLPNPIPPAQVGLGNVHVAFAVGNLLVLGDRGGGIATLDIGDPHNPVLLDSGRHKIGYSMMVNGGRVYGCDDPLVVYDISNPRSITLLGRGPDVAEKGGYGIVQDGSFHYGSSDRIVKIAIDQLPFRSQGTSRPRGYIFPDWDFSTPLGNLAYAGNDHYGSALVVHDVNPDRRGPDVNMISPADGATAQPLTTRIGVTLTDQVDLRSVNTTTFEVRRRNGAVLSGRFSHQQGVLNFWPDQPLEPNAVYEVRVPAGGITDLVGNATPRDFSATFSTGASIPNPIQCSATPAADATPGAPATVRASVQNASGQVEYAWDWGDGTRSSWSTTPTSQHTWAAPGHYRARLEVRTGGGLQWNTAAFTQTVHRPLTPRAPTASGTLAWDAARRQVWNVNPDNDTVTCTDATQRVKLFEARVGEHPRSLAIAPDGTVWVACQDAGSLDVLSPVDGRLLTRISLPAASAPYGVVFSPDGSAAWVTLEATGRLLRLDPAARAIVGAVAVGPRPRGLSVSGDSNTVLVSRFLSPADHGQVRLVDAAGLFVVNMLRLAVDPGPDAEDSGRGVPNYLAAPVISPDGVTVFVPSKKDNTQRGPTRDGLALTFENTVRAALSRIDLPALQEDLAARVDFNDREGPSAVAFSPLGDYAFVALRGSDAVEVRDAYDGVRVSALEGTGSAPEGLLLVDGQLWVHNFLSRSLKVFDARALLAGAAATLPELGVVDAVANEQLSPRVLEGKQIFYRAHDPRMSLDGYLSCASCHLEGDQDARVWDFTDRGEGLRNTISLLGRRGTGQGPLHWTANFDEVQDFENDIRGAFGGRGFLSDAEFQLHGATLGAPKAGLSAELDALAAYVASLDAVATSPHREPSGRLTADALAGRDLFGRLRCADCHSGVDFSDSASGLRHDVGTLGGWSGQRLGGVLDGLDTPTLRGLWSSAPYLHDGSAATLQDVLDRSGPAHGGMASLTAAQKRRLVAYLRQIDDVEPPAPPGPSRLFLDPPEAPSAGAHLAARYRLLGGRARVAAVVVRMDGGPEVRDVDLDGDQRLRNVSEGPHLLEAWLVDASGARIAGTHTRARLLFHAGPARSGGRPRLLVSAPSSRTGRALGLGTFKRGTKLYTDRNFRYYTTRGFKGRAYVLTSNDDKRESGSDFLRLHVNQPVTVYVAYDNRMDARPSWLDGWHQHRRRLWTSDTRRRVFRRDMPAGWVTLGGNRAPDVESMYNPLIAPRGWRP
jgi:DNA-binding beta-propeller fold protein YncE